MTTSPASVAESTFVCGCNELCRSACSGERFYKEHEGKRYCVLHFPSAEKNSEFELTFQRKLNKNDLNFRGIWFTDIRPFRKNVFSRTPDFMFAVFTAVADFSDATFRTGANFFGTTFRSNADFSRANFEGEADFVAAVFNAIALFGSARFKGAVQFTDTSFHGLVDFHEATFKDRVAFEGTEHYEMFGENSSLNMEFAKIEKPERISFHTLTLRPHWFVNVDSRKFEFTNVEWHWQSTRGEIARLREEVVSLPHRMLAIACRQLASNAEESHRYEQASKFRYLAMDARRLEHWRGFGFWRLSWWYWLASGYGERVLRAVLMLFGILLISAGLYMKVGFARWEPRLVSESDALIAKRDETGAPLKVGRAMTYSAAVMTLQKPEPRPATTAAQTIVLLETILGPVQAALLALAIRRKFMR